MIVPVDVVLKGRDFAVTESLIVPQGEPGTWDDAAVRDVLVQILRAIDRVKNPEAQGERTVVLHGFSWIVEPAADGNVVVAIEIPMGAAVAGPFAIAQADFERRIARVIQTERQLLSPGTIH
jgi:hypothetical protein